MELQFYISGSLVCSIQSNIVPTIGAEVTISTTSYKKGMWPGTILTFKVSDEFLPAFDYVEGVVRIDVSDWNVVKEGIDPNDH